MNSHLDIRSGNLARVGAPGRRALVGFGLFVLALVCVPTALSQTPSSDPNSANFSHFTPNSDGTYRFSNRSGTAINQDYYEYDKGEAPGLGREKGLLRKVEIYHCSDKQWKMFAEGSYTALGKDLRYTLERFVNHPTALALLGSLARVTDEPTMAIRYFEHALKLYPQHPFTHALFGKYLVDIEAFDAGIARMEVAIEKEGRMGLYHAWLAEALVKAGQMDRATQAEQKARELGYKGRIVGLSARVRN